MPTPRPPEVVDTSPPWFFQASLPDIGAIVEMEPEEARHVSGARRLAVDDSIVLFDGRGTVTRCRLVTIDRAAKSVQAEILERRFIDPPTPSIALASALPKGDRLATLLNMGAQLGMSRFIPLLCRHSVVTPSANFETRWARILREACKQSRRAYVPVIEPPMTPSALADSTSEGGVSVLVAHPGSAPIGAALRSRAVEYVMVVGPEGGFTKDEVDDMAGSGATLVGLGDGVLRIETAAVAMLAMASMPGRDATGHDDS